MTEGGDDHEPLTLSAPRPLPGGAGLERWTAALLAYLALEGPTPRSRLAHLLWPESAEATARNNLSQTLRQLRRSAPASLLAGEEVLRLAAPLDPDAALALLRLHDYDDLPDFEDWLLASRERRRAAQAQGLRREMQRLGLCGELAAALDLGELLLDLDPVSEEAHRAQMRLRHLLGDRSLQP